MESLDEKTILDLPETLDSALKISNLNNISLLISKLEYEISKKS